MADRRHRLSTLGSADKSLSMSAFYGNYTGYFSNIGQGEMLANLGEGEPAIDYIAPRVLSPHSGRSYFSPILMPWSPAMH